MLRYEDDIKIYQILNLNVASYMGCSLAGGATNLSLRLNCVICRTHDPRLFREITVIMNPHHHQHHFD